MKWVIIDLALVTRDGPSRGELLFKEALVWGGAEQYEAWKRNPLPIAVHGLSERLRTAIRGRLSRKLRSTLHRPHRQDLSSLDFPWEAM